MTSKLFQQLNANGIAIRLARLVQGRHTFAAPPSASGFVFLKILVPTAGQLAAADTADYAMQVAVALDAELLALHVVRPGKSSEAGELSLEYFQKAGRAYGVSVECHFREGAIIRQIVDFANEKSADLIVMGASSGRVFDQWLVSDIRECTPIPVLVIPYQIFASTK